MHVINDVIDVNMLERIVTVHIEFNIIEHYFKLAKIIDLWIIGQ